MALNNNRERKAWWQELNNRYTQQEIIDAMATLKEDAQKVIRMHYEEDISLKNITEILQRSMTTIRSLQTSGIHRIWKYFQAKENNL